MPADRRVVLLIDLSGLYWANWHATADQEISHAHERTLAQAHAYREGYELVAVCCDAPPYWRKEILPEYKAHREAAPPAAVEQLRRVKERLRADGLLVWEAQGFEADDVIAFATQHALEDGHAVRIVSSDKDMHQLVGDLVRVVSPAAGVTYDRQAVTDKHGVGPEQMRDFLALVGDSSDGVHGVPGVGPKTAAALLKSFGSLESVLFEARAKESRISKPKLKAAIMENAEAALLARRIISLRSDVPLNWADIYGERERTPLVEVNGDNMDTEQTEQKPANGHPEEPLPDVIPTAQVPTQAQSTALAMQTDWSLQLEPRSQKGAYELAKALHESKLYMQLQSPEAIYAVIIRGRSLGLDATSALASFHNIRGRLTMHADLIEALVLRSGKAEYFEMVSSDARSATYATKRKGNRREQQITFTIEDALAAQLVTRDAKGQDGFLGISESGKPSNWDKYRALMLRHRAKTQLARAVYADVVLGLYSPDEIDAEAIVVEGSAA